MHLLFEIYIILCALVFITLLSLYTIQDIMIGRGRSNKFNYHNKLSWFILVCLSMPFLNILVVSLIVFLIYSRNKRDLLVN